jgi:hypothetical protein
VARKTGHLEYFYMETVFKGQMTVMSAEGIQPWRPSASSMLFQLPTESSMVTFVPS